jgi:hypothetical protein
MRRLVCALIGSSLFVSLLFGGSAVYAVLVVNGGFESNSFTGWTVATTTAPAPVVTNTAPHTGTYSAEFFDASQADISQYVNVLFGGKYDIVLWLQVVDNDDSYVYVSLGGMLPKTYDFVSGTPGYIKETIPVLANAGSQLLDIQVDTSNNGLGQVYLDDVSINAATAVPEPSTMIAGALLLLPFGSGAIRQFRKKMQAA